MAIYVETIAGLKTEQNVDGSDKDHEIHLKPKATENSEKKLSSIIYQSQKKLEAKKIMNP